MGFKKLWADILKPRITIGKTTLAKLEFPHLRYINLEDLSVRQHVKEDPKDLLENNSKGLILDEIQNAPELLSFYSAIADTSR